MKKLSILFLITIAFVACKESVKGENGVTYKDPAQYNDYIVSRQTSLVKKIMDWSQVAQTNLDSAAKMLALYDNQTTVMIDEIKGMPAYKGDSSLKQAAIKSFTFYKRIFSEDYKRLLDIKKDGSDMTEEGAAEMNSIVNKLSRDEEVLDRAFQLAQKNFAAKHKMKLMDNEAQDKIDKINNEN